MLPYKLYQCIWGGIGNYDLKWGNADIWQNKYNKIGLIKDATFILIFIFNYKKVCSIHIYVYIMFSMWYFMITEQSKLFMSIYPIIWTSAGSYH